MEKVFHEKSSEEKILPEYFFHLEQIYIDTVRQVLLYLNIDNNCNSV
jgi:hypothetical protein